MSFAALFASTSLLDQHYQPQGLLSLSDQAIEFIIFRADKQNIPLCLGLARLPAHGIKNGFISDLKLCSQGIMAAVSQAEEMAGTTIKKTTVIFSGPPPAVLLLRQQLFLHGTRIEKKHLHQLEAKFWPPHRPRLHGHYYMTQAIPYECRLDASPPIDNPLGMVGERLSLTSALVYEEVHALETLYNLLQRSKLSPAYIIDRALAAALGMLSVEEQQQGALALHLDRDSTNLAIIKNFCPLFLARLPIGVGYVAEQLAQELKIDPRLAERITHTLPNLTNRGSPPVGTSIDPRTAELVNLLAAADITHVEAIDEVCAIARRAIAHIINQAMDKIEKSPLPLDKIPLLSLSGHRFPGLNTLLADRYNKRVRSTPASAMHNPHPTVANPALKTGTEIASLLGAALFVIRAEMDDQPGRQGKKSFLYPLPRRSLVNRLMDWVRRNYG